MAEAPAVASANSTPPANSTPIPHSWGIPSCHGEPSAQSDTIRVQGDDMAPSDTTRQNPTSKKAAPTSLTDRQQLALEHLLAGETITATADALGVSRQTIHEWGNDPHFQHALAVGRAERHAAVQRRFERLLEKVLERVEAALDADDPRVQLQAAGLILKHATAPPAPPADFDPIQAQVAHVRAELRREVEREFALTGRPKTALDAVLEDISNDYVEQEVRQRVPGRLRELGLLEPMGAGR